MQSMKAHSAIDLQTYPSLADVPVRTSKMGRSSERLVQRFCIVTPDLLGPVRNGGIGTACTALAYELADAGYTVTILFTQCGTTARSDQPWQDSYRARGIEVVVAAEWQKQQGSQRVFPDHAPLAMALTVYQWLSGQVFDCVLFIEWQGHGFYALQAKQGGIKFQDMVFITQTHSPSLWHAIHNAELPAHPFSSLTYFMERKVVELADAVISPSTYMLGWMRRYGFALPKQAYVQPNLIGEFHVADHGVAEQPAATLLPVSELVFFGRLEYRKGLVQFCDALDRLTRLQNLPAKVTFLGKFARVGDEHSGLYIARRARKWSFPIEIKSRLAQAEALNYLAGPGRLAIMPSVADNSPYTVYECLVMRIPFLARDVGGVAELICEADREHSLFSDNPNALAQGMVAVLQEGARRSRLAFDLDINRAAWRTGLTALVAKVRQPRKRRELDKSATLPRVSVCLTHFNRPALLLQAVKSLYEQDYPNFEVILVDDGSTDVAAIDMLAELEPEFISRGWCIHRQENSYLGRARNAAAGLANGQYLLFMDDDNVAKPQMLSQFIQAAMTSKAELLTSVFDVFAGDMPPSSDTPVVERYLPVGDVVSFSVLTNEIGDANSMISRTLFEAQGGFSEDYGLGLAGGEPLLRAGLAGTPVLVLPESLFERQMSGRKYDGSDKFHAAHTASVLFECLPAQIADLAILAQGQTKRNALKVSCDLTNTLSQCDKSRLNTAQPDAPETLVTLANALLLNNNRALAEQLLLELSNEAKAVPGLKVAIDCLSALKAIDAGNFGELGRIYKASEGLDKNPHEWVSFYVLVLEKLAQQPKAAPHYMIYLNQFAEIAEISNQARLYAARYLLLGGFMGKAIDFLDTALKQAETVYLLERPDVLEAVARRGFLSGLHHYATHGKFENAAWPDAPLFETVMPVFLMAFKKAAKVTVKQETRARLVIGFKAFT